MHIHSLSLTHTAQRDHSCTLTPYTAHANTGYDASCHQFDRSLNSHSNKALKSILRVEGVELWKKSQAGDYSSRRDLSESFFSMWNMSYGYGDTGKIKINWLFFLPFFHHSKALLMVNMGVSWHVIHIIRCALTRSF